MRPIVISGLSLQAADRDGVAQSQTPAGAGNLILNGALVTNGVAVINPQARVTVFSGSDISNRAFTIVGKDGNGAVISEVITGPNNTTVTTLNSFLSVSQVSINGAAAGAVEIGNAQAGATIAIPTDLYANPTNIVAKLSLSGTINATVQYTNDPIFTTPPANVQWTDHTDLQNKTTGYTTATVIAGITALRLVINSGGGSATLTITQGGLQS